MQQRLSDIAQLIYRGDADGVTALAHQALAEGAAPRAILDHGLLAGMNAVGRDFKAGQLFIPEIIVAARAMHAGIEILRPLLADGPGTASPLAPRAAKVVLGTVQGDLHDIGKRLVGIMIEGAGFEVIDLGTDVAPSRFVEAATAHDAQIVGLSALLSTTMPMIKTTIDALRAASCAVRVIVGGAPVTQSWADAIGADGYAPDAVGAVEVVRGLIAEPPR